MRGIQESNCSLSNRSSAPSGGHPPELGRVAGNLTFWFAAMGFEAYGVDIMPAAIDWALEKNASAPAWADSRVEDATELASFALGFFDILIDGHCLHWIRGEDRARVFASVRRVLRIGGFFLLSSQCGDPVYSDRMDEDWMVIDPLRRVLVNKTGFFGG